MDDDYKYYKSEGYVLRRKAPGTFPEIWRRESKTWQHYGDMKDFLTNSTPITPRRSGKADRRFCLTPPFRAPPMISGVTRS